MSGRAKALLMIAALALATPVAAQAPVPKATAFDGNYAGVSREMYQYSRPSAAPTSASPDRGPKCAGRNGIPVPLTITNGVVRATGRGTWVGTVNPEGFLVMRNRNYIRVDGHVDTQGIISGQYSGTFCVITYVWRKQSG